MTSCSASRRPRRDLRVSSIGLVVAALVAGCASRSLNAPQVVDWSDGAQSARPAVVPPTAPLLHTVKRDDTLLSIARRYNTTPTAIAALNNLPIDVKLKVDQVLRISSPSAPGGSAASDGEVAVTQPIGIGTIEQRPLGAASEPAAATPSNAPLKSGPLGVKRPYSDAALAELSKADADGSPAVTVASAAPSVAPSTPVPTNAISWAWPAAGKPSGTFADGKTKGLDVPGKAGDPVLAAADGKVTFAGTGVRGYGNFVIIRHSPELLSVYAHNRTNLVKEGAVVTRGQKIAEMGSSDTDAVKLHFEIRDDSKPVDPMKYLPVR